MALDFGFGKKEQDTSQKQAQTSTARGKRDTRTQQRTDTTQATTGRTTGQQQQTTTERLLAPDVETAISNLLLAETGRAGQVGGATDPSVRTDLLGDLASRAGTADQDIQGSISAIVDASRQRGEQQLRRSTTQLAGSAGSSLSSNVVQLAQRERENLETQLIGAEGGLRLEGRNLATGEISNAVGQLAQGGTRTEIQNITGLADILRGATRTGTTAGTSAQQSEQEQTLASIVAALEQIRTKERGSGTAFAQGRGESSGFNLGASIPLSFGGS